jgi:hypothetical protein
MFGWAMCCQHIVQPPCLYPTTRHSSIIAISSLSIVGHSIALHHWPFHRPPSSPSIGTLHWHPPFFGPPCRRILWELTVSLPPPTTQLTVSLSYRFADCVVNRVRENFSSCVMPIHLGADCVAHKTQLTTSLCAKLADFVANSRVGNCRRRPERSRISIYGYLPFVLASLKLVHCQDIS